MSIDLEVGLRARVTVPGSSANLGPGFDTLGLAVGIYDTVEVEVTGSGLEVEIFGEGAEDLPRDSSHLVVKAINSSLHAADVHAPGLKVTCHNNIPQSRGLGSSASAAVAGVVAANTLAGSPLSTDEVIQLSSAFEGHPDNVAPALVGGATVSWTRDDVPGPATARLRLHERVVPVVAIPDTELSTHVARGVLPAEVPHAVAAAQAGRAALLVHALAEDPALLPAATRDWLHQEPRAVTMPASAALVAGLRERGHAAVVSGAGPTVLALCDGVQAAEHATEAARALTADGAAAWRVLVPCVAVDGVRVESLHHG